MSPDDIFAAQFWPWPDPAIKRDADGRILFVNAAFLGLYGGTVEAWTGSAVGGWPAPQMTAQPFRFETRLPTANGSEQVFDWMEQVMADGNAFALARDVTVFTTSPEPDPGQMAPPLMQEAHPPAQDYAPAPAQDTFAAAEPHYEPAAAPAPAYSQAPVEAPLQPAETFEPAPAAQDIAVPNISVPDMPIPDIAIPDTSFEAAPVAAQPAAEEPREYERRALPIEDESAVLGNNWRDAVIAKAVGAADAAAPAQVEPAPAQTVADVTTPVTAEAKGPITILLAEDNAINALLTRTLLEAEGHTVDTVEDGQLAVEAMRVKPYDLIFMDMRMPNMDGLEATRKIRELHHVGRTLPIIALTANAFDDDRNACFDAGMNDFMTKPVSAEELSEMVNTWTDAKAKERLANAA